MTVYYVNAKTGSDSNNGQSTGSAWASLAKVNASVFKPGDQILFQRGDLWHGRLQLQQSGTADQPIKVGAYGTGNNPVFSGAKGPADEPGVIWNYQVDYIHYQDLTVTDGKVVGFRVHDGNGIVVRNVEAYRNAEDGFRFVGADTANVLVEGGSSHHNGTRAGTPSGHGYVTTGGAHDIVFKGMESYANAQDGFQIGETSGSGHVMTAIHSHGNGYSGFNVKSGTGHTGQSLLSEQNGRYGLIGQLNLNSLSVADSHFLNNSQGGSYANLKLENGVSFTSARNVWSSIGGTGALIHSDGANVTASFRNDVFHEPANNQLFATFWAQAGKSFSFTDNVFSKQVGNGVLYFEPGVGSVDLHGNIMSHAGGRLLRYHEATAVEADQNLYYRLDPSKSLIQVDGFATRIYTAADLASDRLYSEQGTDLGSIFANPLFTNQAAGDLTVAAGSPALPLQSPGSPWPGIATSAIGKTISGTTGNDILQGTLGADTLRGGNGNDVLRGNAGADNLNGGLGDDLLIGGRGADSLSGADGGDRFVFRHVSDSGSGGRDTITDFNRSGDKIDFSAIDANPFLAGDQAFAFIGRQSFSGAAGQLRHQTVTGKVVLEVDLNGDRLADMQIDVLYQSSMGSNDFIL